MFRLKSTNILISTESYFEMSCKVGWTIRNLDVDSFLADVDDKRIIKLFLLTETVKQKSESLSYDLKRVYMIV